MAYVKTHTQEEATGEVAEMYNRFEQKLGFIPNYARAFSQRPRIMDGWVALLKSITANMDSRRYELVTLAAAKALRSSYCSLAHGKVLLDNHVDALALARIASEDEPADLSPAEIAMMRYAQKIVLDAASITRTDVDELMQHGFSDAEVLDIAAAASARCFFSKTLDALGIDADASYRNLPAELQDVLVVGRPIAGE